MNEARLKSLLRETPIPDGESAERRGLAVVSAAFAQRGRPRRNPLPRIALAVAIATLLAALLLSPAGAAVRDWVGDVFTAGVPDAEFGLTEIPGGGRLLVQSPAGPWVVQPDGSRRLLGHYGEATWSPRGLFVGAVSGRTLSAIEPDGTPHWSLSAKGEVSDPRWSPSGFQIAYRAGGALRAVDADGDRDRSIAGRVEPVAPAWAPWNEGPLAFVGADGSLHVADDGHGKPLASGPALAGIADLEWAGPLSPGRSVLLEASRRALRVRRIARRPGGGVELGGAQRVALPVRTVVGDAAISPDGRAVAVLLLSKTERAPRSDVFLDDARGRSQRLLFSTPGRLGKLTWAPDGSRLLISWPDADQWLFVPADRRARVHAIGNVAAEFAPGSSDGSFPQIEGWCCPPQPGA